MDYWPATFEVDGSECVLMRCTGSAACSAALDRFRSSNLVQSKNGASPLESEINTEQQGLGPSEI